mgnify:CR=1 FL=1
MHAWMGRGQTAAIEYRTLLHWQSPLRANLCFISFSFGSLFFFLVFFRVVLGFRCRLLVITFFRFNGALPGSRAANMTYVTNKYCCRSGID